MSFDEHFLIHLDMIDDKNVEQSLKNIDYRLKEISKDLLNVGYGSKEVDVFTNEMKTLSSVTKSVASAVAILNKTNAQAAKDAESVALAHQKVATEAGKTARELEKAKTETANTAVANQKLKTELEKTATAHARAEMAALRVAQAHEKQALRAQQAARPYNQLNQQLREQAQKLQDAIAAGNLNEVTLQRMADKYTRLNTKIQETNQKFAELTKQKQENENILDILKASLGTFIGMLARDFLTNAIQGFKEFAASISRAGIELDALQNTMLAATGGWESGGREIKWVIDMSNRLGLAFGDVSDSYAKFMTSFTRSGGTISQSRQIFEDLSTAMVSLHLPAERMQGVFVALEQMANKGTVQAEELKRQLGNALPGAFELAAESMGILPARLMDLMKKGEVFSKDFLPAFAATVKAALGQSIDIASMQFNASINRLATATDLLKMNLGQMVNEALLPLVNGLVTVTNALAKTAQFFNENTVASNLLKGALVGLLATVVAFNWGAIVSGLAAIGTTIVGTVIPAVGALMSELVVLNAELAGIPLIIGAVVTAVAALGFNLADTAKNASDITPYIGLGQQIVNLTKEVTALDTATDEGKQKLEEFKQSFPELTNYLTETGKKFSELSDEELKHIAVLGEHDAKMRALNERTKEMASWQMFLKATCEIAWQAICDAAKVLWQSVLDTFVKIVQGFKDVINSFGLGMEAIGNKLINFGKDSGHIMAITVGQALKDQSTIFTGLDENIQNLKDNAAKGYKIVENKVSDVTKRMSEWQWVINATDRQISNANQNFLKKNEIIQKNAKLTYNSLRQAQSAVGGLQAGGIDAKKGSKKGGNAKEKAEDAWQSLNKQANETLELIRVNKMAGKNTEELEKVYLGYKKQIDEVNKAIEKLNKQEKQINMTAAEQAIKIWEDKKKALQNAEKQYKGMLVAGNAYTKTEIEQQRILMRGLKAETQYNDYLANRENLMQISSRTARDFGNTLVDAIFNPMEGETFWERLRDVGLSALKSIATSWSKTLLDGMVKGFGAGFVGTGGSFFQNLQGGILGMITGAAGKQIGSFGIVGGGTLGLGSALASAASLTTILGQLQQQSNGAAQGVTNLATSALNASSNMISTATSALSAGTNISGVTSPAVSAAQSIANMAVAAPIAATGMGALAAAMAIASGSFQTSAPALMQMAGAMGALATSAATAATSMAAVAVANAANSAAQIPFVGWLLAPLAAVMTGAGIAAGTALTGAAIGASTAMAGAGQMIGGAMAGIGNQLSGVSGLNKGSSTTTSAKVIPHAKGGIVSSPTMFPMQGGNFGLAGEAGTEVIAPARRMSNGDVGIGAVQPQVIVNNYTNAAVEVKKRPDNTMEIKIAELNAMLSSSRTNRGMSNAQNRMQRKGRQIG